ncbi:hypothetical protein GCM10009799_00020 [Nocardiopsis rhodophaea]|uniref:Fe2OG dioxygenase domain-containing protein n=1 Tax=Nocardiopsis rhodophaea TaxID=280238 RepID=A0ABN2S2C6_9ACTN
MIKTNSIPKFSTGLNPIKATFNQRKRFRHKRALEGNHPIWTSAYVADDPIPERITMQDFGYPESDLARHDGRLDDTAVVTPIRLFTEEGSRLLSRVCKHLEKHAVESDFIISRRTRGGDLISPFLYNMLRDRQLLVRMSKIAGVPLLPHVVRDAAVQINYYSPESGPSKEIGKWHVDGMEYVFTILMTDPSEFTGGQFGYYFGRQDEFDNSTSREDRVKVAPLERLGDGIFARGAHIYHGVSPVESGSRMVLTLSMMSPAFVQRDPNTFSHIAADDGIIHTIPNWLRLKWPTHNPFRDYALRSGSPVITWNDIN